MSDNTSTDFPSAWTEDEDKFLIGTGRRDDGSMDGYRDAAIALGRQPEDGVQRIAHLQVNRPEWVRAIEVEAAGP